MEGDCSKLIIYKQIQELSGVSWDRRNVPSVSFDRFTNTEGLTLRRWREPVRRYRVTNACHILEHTLTHNEMAQ